MEYIDRFRRKAVQQGQTLSEQYNKRLKSLAQTAFIELPNARTVVLSDRSYENEWEQVCIIEDIRVLDDRIVDDKMILIPWEDDIQVGYTVNWDEKRYIVYIEEQNSIDSHKTSRIRPTNYLLNFIDKSGVERSYYSIVSNKTLYSDGVRDSEEVVSINQKMHVVLPYNEHTRKLERDDRLMLFEDVYRITNIDRTKVGLMQFILTEDTINTDTDNFDSKVADSHKETTHLIKILNGTNIETTIDSAITLDIIVLDGFGKMIDNPVLTFGTTDSLIAMANSDGIVRTTQEGIVDIVVGFAGVTESVRFNVVTTPVITHSIDIDTPTVLNEYAQQIITAYIYENGVLQTGITPTFELIDENATNIGNGDTNSIARIVDALESQVTIRVNNGYVGETFSIKATYNGQSNQVDIVIKSIFG